VYFPDTQFNVEAYAPFGLTLSLLMMASILITALGTKRRIPHLPASRINRESVSILRVLHKTLLEIRSALTNRSFRWLFAGVLIVFAMVGVDNALNLHMNTYFWELQGGGNLFFFAATPVGALIGTALASPLTRWFDKKPSVIIGTLCWALCQVIPVVLRLLGWFPENGTSELLYSLIVIKFIQGLGVVQALIAFNSMVADVVDEHELITGLRQEGIFFSSVSFSNKMTSGIGTVAAGFALALIDWPTGAAVQTAADIAPETIAWLGLIYGPIVSGFALVSAYCYSKYGLNRQRHAEIVEELAVLRERRAAAAD
jgi:Na+/melibiose symporter-like transporter